MEGSEVPVQPQQQENDVGTSTAAAGAANKDDRRNTTEAGIARGAVRAISKSSASTAAVKLQVIGSLPRPAMPPAATSIKMPTISAPKVGGATRIMPRRLPVKQVAKVSDRASQGLDLYNLVSNETSPTAPESNLVKFRSFATNLVKNTILGMAVFSTYEIVIESLAPRQAAMLQSVSGTDNSNTTTSPAANSKTKRDPYAHASVVQHGMAGALGGSMHGVAGIAWDTTSTLVERYKHRIVGQSKSAATTPGLARVVSNPNMLEWRSLRMIGHHATAHAVLFASYEATKRGLLSVVTRYSKGTTNSSSTASSVSIDDDTQQLVEDETVTAEQQPMTRIEYLGCVAVAGGLAGQFQHVVSHYTEPMAAAAASPSSSSSTSLSVRWKSIPALLPRPLLMAFLPSSIAFVALEYGRRDGRIPRIR